MHRTGHGSDDTLQAAPQGAAAPAAAWPAARRWGRGLMLALAVALGGCAALPDQPVLYQVARSDGASPPNLSPATPAQAQAGLKVQRGSQALAPVPGLGLAAGDRLETGPEVAAVIRFPDGHEAVVLPNSRVHIGSLLADFGEIFVRVFQQAQGRFKVQTRYVTAGVEGTAFWVRVDAHDQLSVGVTEGRVRLSSVAGRWESVTVLPDEVATMLRDAPPTKAQRDRAQSDHIVRFVTRMRLPPPRLPARPL